MNAVAFIFARGGSKGFPDKNLKSLAGKPLLAWAIEQTRAVKRIRRVIVSTDSEKIAQVARAHGAEAPFLRPTALASDESPEWLAWRHALKFIEKDEGALPKAMVSVPVTAPLRQPEDLEKCLDIFAAGETDIVITITRAHRNPYFNMVKKNSDGTVGLVIPPEEVVGRRQDAPQVFDMTTVAYVADPQFVLSHDSLFAGRVRAVQIPEERAIDIDTRRDLEMAEFLRGFKPKI